MVKPEIFSGMPNFSLATLMLMGMEAMELQVDNV